MKTNEHKTGRLIAPAVAVAVLAALTLAVQASVLEGDKAVPTHWWAPAQGIEAKPFERIQF